MMQSYENKIMRKRRQFNNELTLAEQEFIRTKAKRFNNKKAYFRHLLTLDGFDIKLNDVNNNH